MASMRDYIFWDMVKTVENLNQPFTYTEKDLKNMGMNVRCDNNDELYLDTPYGKCYLKNEPGYREG